MITLFRFPSVITRLFLPHKRKRTLRSRALMFDDYQQTDSMPPDYKQPTDKQTGAYCIKSSIDLVHHDNGQPWYNIYGYDDNLSIQERVRGICSAYQQGDPEHLRCDNEKLVFLGPRKQCSGQVHLLDVPKDHLYSF